MNVAELSANVSYGSFNILPLRDVLVDSERFCFVDVDGEQTVVAKTRVRLCMAKDCHGCLKLHLCKRFLLGVCQRIVCRFGHELATGKNAMVLRNHGLEDLDKEELCTLLLQNDSSLLPPVSKQSLLRVC